MSYSALYDDDKILGELKRSRRVVEMSQKRLTNIQPGKTWTTYLASVEGALRGAGFWNDETYLLMGMTGMAFHFIVHDKACPSSVTVYNWPEEHFSMMDRIGIHSDIYQVYFDTNLNTFYQTQNDAICRIKESIDREIPVVVWAPTPILEFGLIDGYDDSDRVFFTKSSIEKNPDPLRYENLGRSQVPILFYQIVKEKVIVEPVKIYRESLRYGLSEWNKDFHISSHYASGRNAYGNLIATMDRRDFNGFGLGYLLAVYCDSKASIAKYLEHIMRNAPEFTGIEGACGLYLQISQHFRHICELIPFNIPEKIGERDEELPELYKSGKISGNPTQSVNEYISLSALQGKVDQANLPEALELIRRCSQLEERAMSMIEQALKNV